MDCSKCDSGACERIDRHGALETWRCVACGHEVSAHVLDGNFESRMREVVRDGPPRVFTNAKWRQPPTKDQAASLQQLLPDRLSLTVTQIMRAGFEGSAIDFGPSLRTDAEALAGTLDELGQIPR